ncbi:MAG: hypothetical protein JST93_29760 [Acidobacteria bacterium]|nr:hypothetical protein [Acidobacteriota bacterium]
MNHILHIAAKDLAALRAQALLLVLLQFTYSGLTFTPEQPGMHSIPANLGGLVLLLAHAWFISSAVHAEAIVGHRQYWLTRPIARRDLFAAKLLAALAVIHLPLLLSDCVILIGHQFSPFPYLPGLLWRQILYLLTVTLPLLAIAAATANLAQFAAAMLFATVTVLWLPNMLTSPFRDPNWGGFTWVKDEMMFTLAAAAGILLLFLLYGHRRVATSRVIIAIAPIFILTCYARAPFPLAFRLQRYLGSAPPAELHATFDAAAQQSFENSPRVRVYIQNALMIPFRFDRPLTGLDLYLDHAEGTLRTPSGATLNLRNVNPQPLDPESPGHALHLPIEREFLTQHRTESVTLDLTLYLTSFRPAHKYTMPVRGAGRPIGELGHCRTRTDPGMVFIACSTPIQTPPRATVYLVHPVTGVRTVRDMRLGEFVDYSPLPANRFTFQPISNSFNYFSTMHLAGDNLMNKDFQHLLDSNAEFLVRAPQSHFTVNLSVPPTPLKNFIR